MVIALTSILLSAIALLAGFFIGRSNPGKSSLFTAGSILLLLLMPFTHFLPKLQIALPIAAASASNSAASGLPWLELLFFLWLAGAALLLSRLAFHSIAVRRWRRNSERCTSPQWTHRLHECCSQLNMDTIPSLGLSEDISSPVVTGLVYPQILLPSKSQQWNDETINHVLLHELGHVKRRDLWISVASHIACALHWFNPLVWILRKQQATQCEFACDAFVLSSGANAKRYIHAMCDVAETASSHSKVTLALAMADKASLRQRVEILLSEQRSPNIFLTFFLLLASASVSLAINLVRPTTPPEEKIAPDVNFLENEVKIRFEADPFPENQN